MILNCYSIYDIKAQIYSPPFYALTDGAACRIVQDSLSGDTSLARHPADFIIYKVGTFSDDTGYLEKLTPREHVRDVISLVPPMPKPFDFMNGAPTVAKTATDKETC